MSFRMKRSGIEKSKSNYSFEISPQGRNDNLNVISNETEWN
jgi:hypothetical protein